MPFVYREESIILLFFKKKEYFEEICLLLLHTCESACVTIQIWRSSDSCQHHAQSF